MSLIRTTVLVLFVLLVSAGVTDAGLTEDVAWTGDARDLIYVPVGPGDVSDAMLEDLLALGYAGSPDDGREALYVWRGHAVDACRTDAECAYASTAGAIGHAEIF